MCGKKKYIEQRGADSVDVCNAGTRINFKVSWRENEFISLFKCWTKRCVGLSYIEIQRNDEREPEKHVSST
jgi:hypothetical protein